MTRGAAVPAESRGGVFGVDPGPRGIGCVEEIRDHFITHSDNSFSRV